MIPRYTRPEMGHIWSEENGFQKWLEVEILAAEGLARLGKVPKAAITRIRRKARFNVKRIRAIEAEVKHEIIAFLELGRRIDRRRRPLSPCRHDFVGRDGHGAGDAVQRSFGADRSRH